MQPRVTPVDMGLIQPQEEEIWGPEHPVKIGTASCVTTSMLTSVKRLWPLFGHYLQNKSQWYFERGVIRALEPLQRMVLPPGEHNGISVYALSPNGKKFHMIHNAQKITTNI